MALSLALSLFLSLLEDRSFERLNNVALEITATKQGHAMRQDNAGKALSNQKPINEISSMS